MYSDESKTSKLTVTVKDYNNGLYILEEMYDRNGTLYPNTTIAVHKYSNLLVCSYEDGSIGCLTCTSDTILGHYDFYMNGSHNVIACEMSTSGTGSSSVPDLSGKVYEGKSYGLDSNGKRTEIAYSVSFGANHGNLFDVLYVYNGITYTMTAAVAYDSIDKGYYVTTTDVYMDDNIGLIADYYFGYVSKDLKHYYDDIPEYWIEKGYATYYGDLNLTDKVGFLGTYEFQGGTYAEIINNQIEYRSWTEEDDITIYSYDGINFYGKWGEDPFIGSFDGEYMQIECVYKENGSLYSTLGFGYIDRGTLCFGADLITDDSIPGAFTTVFAKKGTKAAMPEFKPILEKGQTFESYECNICIDGVFKSASSDYVNRITVLDANNGVYLLKDEGVNMFGQYQYLTIAVQRAQNTIVCVYDDVSFGSITCSSGYIDAFYDYYVDGRHVISSYKLSATGEYREYSVPVLAGKKYEGTLSMVSNANYWGVFDYSLTFGANHGSLYEVQIAWAGTSYKILANIVYDDVNKGYHLTAVEDKVTDDVGIVLDYTFGYISEDLKKYTECTSTYTSFGVDYAFCGTLKLAE